MSEEQPIKCDRKFGKCDRCNQERMLIYAFDDRVYVGGVCYECFFEGKASNLALEDPLMRPMLFVARALRGDEPFASILRSADSQSMDLEKSAEALKEFQEEARKKEELLNRVRTQRILKSRGFPVPDSQSIMKNRKQRRADAAIARKAARKARKASQAKSR